MKNEVRIMQQFINAKWHTVPLKGELRRKADGKKTIPKFETGYRDKYSKELNTTASLLGGALTGKVSGIVAIDCDNQATFDMFKALDADYTFHFVSKDKPKGGGTIIYSYDDSFNKSFSVNNELVDLDFLSNNKFLYLPTEHNYTKEAWTFDELPTLKDIPALIKMQLNIMNTTQVAVEPIVSKSIDNNYASGQRLEPLVKAFVKKGKYSPKLFKIITPRVFRKNKKYVSQGHMHPNDIVDGSGSDYLSRVSAILGSDMSINQELYTKAIGCINNLWDSPMAQKDLSNTIIKPMVSGASSIDGVSIWAFDKYWDEQGIFFTGKNGESLESFYDGCSGLYYLINYTENYTKFFKDVRPCISQLGSSVGFAMKAQDYNLKVQNLKAIHYPQLPYGHIPNKNEFNLFKQTPALEVLNNPSEYASRYKEPTYTLNYFKSLIPDDDMRAYVLSFLRTKLTTFNYSPVVLYFLGMSGSGKDVFMNIIKEIIGDIYVDNPTSKVFLEKHNGWIIDKYFVQLSEYGDSLTSYKEKKQALGLIKSISGSKDLQVRAMNSDAIAHKHNITLVLTANTHSIDIDMNDRRLALIDTPNKLKDEGWINNSNEDITNIVSKIQKDEILDFCYYLSTEIENLSGGDYIEAPKTNSKTNAAINLMDALNLIVYHVEQGNYTELLQLRTDNDLDNSFIEGWAIGRIYFDSLVDLYEAISEREVNSKPLMLALRDKGLNRKVTTKDNVRAYYYDIGSKLEDFSFTNELNEEGFKAVKSSDGFKDVEIEELVD